MFELIYIRLENVLGGFNLFFFSLTVKHQVF